MTENETAMGYLESISQHRIAPPEVSGAETAADLIDRAFSSYNAGRLREVCRVFTRKMLQPDCTVGLTLSGALTPAGLGMSCLIPLIQAGFVDWIVSTGANLYHDTHYALDLPLHQSRPNLDDLRAATATTSSGSTTSSSTTRRCSTPMRSTAS